MTEHYKKASDILTEVYHQISSGKGHERHGEDEVNWEDQSSFKIRELVSEPFLFQAVKKVVEAQRLPDAMRRKELIGAIGYVVMEIQRGEEIA